LNTVYKPNDDAEALPRLLVAVHVYSPVSALTAWDTNSTPPDKSKWLSSLQNKS